VRYGVKPYHGGELQQLKTAPRNELQLLAIWQRFIGGILGDSNSIAIERTDGDARLASYRVSDARVSEH